MNAPWWRLAESSTRTEDEDVDADLLPPFYD